MAHKKGAGSSRNGRDSNSKRLGVKLFGVSMQKPVISSFAKEEQNIIPA